MRHSGTDLKPSVHGVGSVKQGWTLSTASSIVGVLSSVLTFTFVTEPCLARQGHYDYRPEATCRSFNFIKASPWVALSVSMLLENEVRKVFHRWKTRMRNTGFQGELWDRRGGRALEPMDTGWSRAAVYTCLTTSNYLWFRATFRWACLVDRLYKRYFTGLTTL